MHGDDKTGSVQTEDGYQFTAKAVVAADRKIMESKDLSGVLTPSRAFGSRFLEETGGTLAPVEIY